MSKTKQPAQQKPEHAPVGEENQEELLINQEDLLPESDTMTSPLGEGDESLGVVMAEIGAEGESQIAALQEKLAEQENMFLRAKADTENLRRRMQEDIVKAHKFAAEKFANDLLAVKDSLEAAIAEENQDTAAMRSGVELTLKQLVSCFEKATISEINPIGEKFDPHWHQAISQQPSEGEANLVLNVLQKGYAMHERILRPAMVIVSKQVD